MQGSADPRVVDRAGVRGRGARSARRQAGPRPRRRYRRGDPCPGCDRDPRRGGAPALRPRPHPGLALRRDPGNARLTLHRRTGEVLEALYGIDREAHLAELVHHFFLAIPEADPERTVEYARRAGHVAVARLAFEEAARLFGMALEALKLTRQPDDDLRCELLLGKGDAHARAGDTLAAKDSFFAAADLARRLDNPEQLCRAAIGYGGRIVWLRAGRDRRFIPLLEDALRATGERSSPERVRLMARLACALRGSPDRERSANLGRQALEMARELGDPRTLAYALNGRLGSTYWPENPKERLELADEMVGLADAAGDLEDSFEGHHWRAISLVELGEIGRAASELDVMRALAEELRQPTQGIFVTILTSALELMRGRFRQAEEFLERVPWASTPSLPLVDASEAVVPCQRWRLLREAGRLEEAVDVIEPAAESFVWYPFLRCAHADVLFELGDGIGARAIYEELAADRFSAIPRDSQWMLAMSLISPVCAALDDVAPGRSPVRVPAPVRGSPCLRPRGKRGVGVAGARDPRHGSGPARGRRAALRVCACDEPADGCAPVGRVHATRPGEDAR